MVRKTKSNQCVSMATIQMEEQWKPKTKRAGVEGGSEGSESAERHNSVFCMPKVLKFSTKKEDLKHAWGKSMLDFSRQIFCFTKRRR